jgi:hypothetical protein
MPFHLEKGRVLGALDDLLNAQTGQKAQDLATAYASLMSGDDLEVALSTISSPGGPIGQSLGEALQKWFDVGDGTGNGYWKDYDPKHALETASDGVRFALERAWGGGATLPTDRSRPVHTWWYCVQPWFDTWVTWENAQAPVRLIFSTPSHLGGAMVTNMNKAVQEQPPLARKLAPGDLGSDDGDMVLIGRTRHQRKKVSTTMPSPFGQVSVPKRVWSDLGPAGRWSIPIDGGGIQPKAKW